MYSLMTISGYDCWKRKGLSRRRKLKNVGVETTSSGSPFQIRGPEKLKVRLPTIDSRNIGTTTRRLEMAERSARRPCRSATRSSGPRYRGSVSCRTLYVSKLPQRGPKRSLATRDFFCIYNAPEGLSQHINQTRCDAMWTFIQYSYINPTHQSNTALSNLLLDKFFVCNTCAGLQETLDNLLWYKFPEELKIYGKILPKASLKQPITDCWLKWVCELLLPNFFK